VCKVCVDAVYKSLAFALSLDAFDLEANTFSGEDGSRVLQVRCACIET
jgi:hypothetical protein